MGGSCENGGSRVSKCAGVKACKCEKMSRI